MSRPTAANPDFLRLWQIAALLNISEREVQRLCDRGELPRAYVGRAVLVPRAAYEALRDRYIAQAGVAPSLVPLRKRGAR